MIDLGWNNLMVVFSFYGQSGGSKVDVAVTEAILDAARMEMMQDQSLPTIITGDLNANLERLIQIRELVEEEG